MIAILKKTLLDSTRLVYQNKKFVILYWLTNIGFSLALTVPVFSMLYEHLHRSAINSHFTGEFDYLWFIQFLELNKQMVSSIPWLLYAVTLLYNLIQLFYTGGLLAVSNTPKKNHTVDFFYGGVRYFYRFFFIFVLTVFFFFIAISVNSLLYGIIDYLFAGRMLITLEFYAHILRYLVFLFTITVVTFVSDYTKIVIVVNDEVNIFRIVARAIIFIKKNFSVVIVLFLLLASCVLAAAILYNVVDGTIPKSSLLLIALTFSIQQLLIVFRLIMRMVFFTSELIIFRDLNAEIISPLLTTESEGE